MVLFSDEHCGYCERLKTEVLEPLVKRGELKNVAKILEFDIDRGGKIRDFDGEKIRTRIFVSRYDVYATPTLMLVDHQGRPLGTPIVGFNNQQDYAPYLADLIEKPSVSSQLGDLQAVRVSLQ
jgi:thioredoxin-related protein